MQASAETMKNYVCFNSSKVQLEHVAPAFIFCNISSFNSSKVQLEQNEFFFGVLWCFLFQFQ